MIMFNELHKNLWEIYTSVMSNFTYLMALLQSVYRNGTKWRVTAKVCKGVSQSQKGLSSIFRVEHQYIFCAKENLYESLCKKYFGLNFESLK